MLEKEDRFKQGCTTKAVAAELTLLLAEYLMTDPISEKKKAGSCTCHVTGLQYIAQYL